MSTAATAKTRRDAILARIDGLQRRIAAVHAQALSYVLTLAVNALSRTGGRGYWSPHAIRYQLDALELHVASLMRQTFSGLVFDGHKAAVAVIVAGHKPRRHTEAIGDDNQLPDSQPSDESPDRPPDLADDSVAAAIERMKLLPMSVDEAREILYSKNPWGLTWEEQLAKSSKMVADPAAMANALADGIAADESLPKLRQRIMPLVENLNVSAQRIARTEGLRVSMTAQQRQYDKADKAGVGIKGMRLHCAMAPASAPDHKKRNLKFYPKVGPAGSGQYVAKDGEPYPGTPYGHANCMCFGSPEFTLPTESQA
jgi:hypothetical protein